MPDRAPEQAGRGPTGQHRQRRVAVLVLFVVLVLLPLAVYDVVVEYWCLRRLESADYFERSSAATKLAELQSEKAIPVFLEILKNADRDQSFDADLVEAERWVSNSLIGFGPKFVDRFREAALRQGINLDVRLLMVLRERGPDAAGFMLLLRELLSDEDAGLEAAFVLSGIGPPAIDPLIQELSNQSPVARRYATYAIASISRDGDEVLRQNVVTALLNMLGDSDPGVREQAVEALGERYWHTELIAPRLIKALEDEDEEVRRASLRALGGIGPHKESVAALIRVMGREESNDFFWQEIQTLVSLDPTGEVSTPLLIAGLKSELNRHRAQLAIPLAAIGKSQDGRSDSRVPRLVTQALLEALDDDNAETRGYALWGLDDFRSAALVAVPKLRQLLRDESGDVRARAAILLSDLPIDDKSSLLPTLVTAVENGGNSNAAEAIANLGIAARQGVPVLLEALNSSDRNLQDSAYGALRKIRADPEDLLPGLVNLLQRGGAHGRALAASLLGELGKDASPAVPALVNALGSNDSELQDQLTSALGKVGVSAASVVAPLLIQLLKVEAQYDGGCALPDPDCRPSKGLVKIGGAAVPALLEALKDADDVGTRAMCALILGEIGKPAEDIAGARVRSLQGDPDMYVRESAARALGKLPGDLAIASRALRRAIRSTDPGIRYRAAAALAANKEDRLTVISVLAELVCLESFALQSDAAKLLGEMGADTGGAVTALTRALRSKDQSVRREAVNALGQLGNAARSCIPALREMLVYDRYNTEQRWAIEAALERIRNGARPKTNE